ncbi:MAG: CaiB/BaiF CoA transferase family protein [Acidimicrobiia bacterium]
MNAGARPLEGLRVVELSIAIAAPSCGRMLAFFGADVMKVESQQHPDVARLFGSAWARTPELASVFTDTSPYLPEMNANKRSVGLNLKSPAALAAVKELIANSDVFLTNYSTPAVTDLGLGAEVLRELNPRLIYAALPAFGSDPSRPYYEFISWGPNQAPLVGLDAVTGFADQEPAGIAAFAPPDYFAGLHAFMGIMTALEHRDRTGEGCWVDLSQFEITVSALAPYVLDQQLSGEVVGRSGNRVDWYAPQGVYPCSGSDRWVAITAHDDDAWRALAALIEPGGALGGDAALATLEGRRADDAHDRIDAAIAAWTATRSPEAAAAALQAVGVAAYPVHSPETQLTDAQLTEYGWYRALPSFRFPDGDLCGGSAMRLHGTPGRFTRGAPTMGEHTVDVLAGVAGLAAGTIDDLLDEGAAFTPTAPDLKLHRPYEHVLRILGLDEEDPA